MACLRKRRDRWVIDFYDTRGKRRWKTLPKGTTKGKARDAIREIEDQLARGVYLPEKRIPLFKDVAADWLEQKKLNVRASTWEMYRGHVDNHFADIENIRLNRIQTSTVEKFIVGKQAAKINITTLRKLIVTFNQIMSYAVRHKFIDYNPVRDAERPKNKGQIKKKEIVVLTTEQVSNFLNAVKLEKYRIFFRAAVMSGARQGELIGLKWTDIDWLNNQIHIQRSFNHGAWYDTKSETSNRRIDLGPSMMIELKRWRVACLPNDLDLVFPNEAGKPLDHWHIVDRYFLPALRAAECPIIRFHDLRHTYASLLIEQGENIKYIQSQLGHSSPTVTLNIYAHLINPTNQAAACRLENSIFKSTGSKPVAFNKKGSTLKVVNP